jgi:hypothetical protein
LSPLISSLIRGVSAIANIVNLYFYALFRFFPAGYPARGKVAMVPVAA